MSSIEELMQSVASIVPYPVQRFTPWDNFPNATKDFLEETFGYSQRRWDKPGTLNLEYKKWENICFRLNNGVAAEECDQTTALRELGFTPETWECW